MYLYLMYEMSNVYLKIMINFCWKIVHFCTLPKLPFASNVLWQIPYSKCFNHLWTVSVFFFFQFWFPSKCLNKVHTQIALFLCELSCISKRLMSCNKNLRYIHPLMTNMVNKCFVGNISKIRSSYILLYQVKRHTLLRDSTLNSIVFICTY